MQQALEQSKRVIAVLSKHYLDAAYTHPEWEAAFLQDPTGSEGGLIPVRVSECKVPKMLRRLIYIDLVDIAEFAFCEFLFPVQLSKKRSINLPVSLGRKKLR